MTLFVYFVQAGDDTGPIKIGYSSNVEKRIESLQTGNPLPLRLLASIAHDRADILERKLHTAFHDLRMEGEWFSFHRRILDTLALLVDDFCTAHFTEICGEDNAGVPILGEVRCERVRGHDGLHRSQYKRGNGMWSGPCR